MALILGVIFAIVAICSQKALSIDMKGCQGTPYEVEAIFQLKGDIYSPGYEEKMYPNNLYCVYTITTLSTYKIKLTFKEIDIDPFGMCGKDRMYIYDGPNTSSKLIGSYCGTEPPPPIVTERNAVYLMFFSDYMTGRKGFHLQYEAIPNDNICPEGYAKCRNNLCYKTAGKCDGNDDCGDGTDEEDCRLPLAPFDCGSNPIAPFNGSEGRDRIIGGKAVRPGSWPWQADMQLKSFYPNGHTCGGTLINPQWVMSAIHCLMSAGYSESWRIHLGNHHKYIKDKYEQVRYVDRIVIYPGYTGEEIINKPIDIVNDVALFKLNAPVRITDYVRPACIPPQGYEIPIGNICMATGWGTTRGSGNDDVLKQVDMTVRRGSECPGFHNQTMICLRNEKGFQDVCHGDSGGPLNYKIGNKWYVMGVASFVTSTNMMGGLCAMPMSGGVYNKVSAKTQWISDMIERFS